MTITLKTVVQFDPQPPAGYAVYTVRGYPIVGYGVKLDAVASQSSMWAIVPVWTPETRTFSAVNGNVSKIGALDIQKLIALQPQDGIDTSLKMEWLVSTQKGIAPMWTDGMEWDNAPSYYVGSQLWAGQPVAASVQTYEMSINNQWAVCRKVLPFRRIDWDSSAPWLFPYVTIASRINNSISTRVFNRGMIRVMQQVLNVVDFPFVGNQTPSGFYVPVEWLE